MAARLSSTLAVLVIGCGGAAPTPAMTTVPNSTAQAPSDPGLEARSARPQPALDTATIGGVNFALLDGGHRCVLRIDGPEPGELAVEATPPCFFLRRASEQPQVFSYPDVGVEAVAIFAGSPISAEQRELRKAPADALCGSTLQAVLIKAGQPSASKLVYRDSIGCRDLGKDEKYFWDFAHPNE